MEQELETEIQDELEDADAVVPLKYEITSYGADFLVDGLVRRLQDGDIFVPDFQRGFVWSHPQASRFIESLLLGLPVPGIFLSKDFDTQKMLVIDGQQRLRTLQCFYEGVFSPTGREFALGKVQERFDGLTYRTLTDQDRRRMDNSILHATIVQQESPPEDDSSIYYIFERLNTTGTPLSPQEVRSCIYRGKFNNLLKELNNGASWRSIFGRINKRMRDQELILRFFALYFDGDKYKSPMREFLNQYMARNRKLTLQPADQLTEVFSNTIEVINEHLGNQVFRFVRALNAALFDSIMIGITRRLKEGPMTDSDAFQERYLSLIKNQNFLDATLTSTADERNVRNRIKLATEAFEDLE